MTTKSFDCVELQHQGAKRIYEHTKQLSLTEELIYWQQRTQELQRLQSERLSNSNAKQKLCS
jgi:hypothetical protein